MSFLSAISEHLAGKTEVTDLVSTRIFKQRASTRSLDNPSQPLERPYITYRQVDNEHTHHLGGDSGLASPLIQINCWDDDYDGAHTLFEAVREEMDTFKGTMGSDGDATTVRGTICTGDFDTFLPGEGREGGLYGVTSNWEFVVLETAATP